MNRIIAEYGDELRRREGSFVSVSLPGPRSQKSRILYDREYGFIVTAPFKYSVLLSESGDLREVEFLHGPDINGIPTERLYEFLYGYCYAFALAAEHFFLGHAIEVMHGVHISDAQTQKRTILHAWLRGENQICLDASGVESRDEMIAGFLSPGYLDVKIEILSPNDLWERCVGIKGEEPLSGKTAKASHLIADLWTAGFFPGCRRK